MERMRNQEKVRENVKKWRKENREKYNEYVRNYWKEKRRKLKELEEENKKLLKLSEHKTEVIMNLGKRKDELEEENKKLKKERDLYKARDEELNENCFGLAKENENLKSDLSECECSFGFESDEVGYRKREYKRLKKRIKDHCNGYGNLFPEDEMKRQWKKADKKRKLKGMLMEEDTLQELRDIGEI